MVLTMSFIEIRTPQKFTDPEGLIIIPDLSSNILVDLDADTIEGAHGSTIPRWEAGGELGMVLDAPIAYGANQMPTLGTDGAAGRNYVQFTGSNSLEASAQDHIVDHDEPTTVVFVMRRDSPELQVGRILSGRNSVPNFRNIHLASGKATVAGSVEGQSQRTTALPTAAPVGEWGAYVARFGNGKISIMSSFGETSEREANSGPLTGLIMGTTYTGGAALVGSIACLRIYGREMLDAEAKALLQNIGDSYNIPVS